MKQVRLYRVTSEFSGGLVPKGYAEGQVIAMTPKEIETMEKRPEIRQFFEEIWISPNRVNDINEGDKNEKRDEDRPAEGPATTADAADSKPLPTAVPTMGRTT